MITLVEGMIGSGKTYYVVNDILTKYFVYDENLLVWKLKENEEVAIYSNVDRFNISLDLMETIRIAGGLNPFFTVNYQREFSRLKKHIYVIDEAQKPGLFHRKYYDAEVFYFFQYLRHLGIDIYLITQDVGQLAKELQTLNEYHIKVVRRSYSYAKEFRYNFMVGRDIFRRKALKKDLRVFSAYRSSNVLGGGHSVKSLAYKYYIYVGLFILCTVGGFLGFIKYGFSASNRDVVKSEVPEVVKTFKIIAINGDMIYLKGVGAEGKMVKVYSSVIVGEIKVGSMVSLKI